jgi:hypothetical protein
MQAFADRLASLASGAHSATLSLLQRLGLGGAAAIGSKTAAVCVGVVCAAGAGVGEFTGVLPPIRAPDHVRKHAAHTPAATHRFAAATPGAAGRSATPPAPPPAARPATSSLTSLTGNSSAPTTASSTPTPGDLQVSTSTRTQTSTPSSQTSSFATGEATSTPATSGAESCVPGSLGC